MKATQLRHDSFTFYESCSLRTIDLVQCQLRVIKYQEGTQYQNTSKILDVQNMNTYSDTTLWPSHSKGHDSVNESTVNVWRILAIAMNFESCRGGLTSHKNVSDSLYSTCMSYQVFTESPLHNQLQDNYGYVWFHVVIRGRHHRVKTMNLRLNYWESLQKSSRQLKTRQSVSTRWFTWILMELLLIAIRLITSKRDWKMLRISRK